MAVDWSRDSEAGMSEFVTNGIHFELFTDLFSAILAKQAQFRAQTDIPDLELVIVN